MLKKREKLMIKVLILAMCTSLLPTTITFAEEKDNTQEKVSNVVQTTGAAVNIDKENTITGVANFELVNSNATAESNFEFDSDTGKITKYVGDDTNVVIPSTINGVSVKGIKYRAFDSCSSITNITIPDSVTSIEYCAFNACSSLISITIPNSVTSIGDSAFNSCSSLTSIKIPNGVTSIVGSEFQDCSSLTSITIPNSVTSIAESAFENCSSLTSIAIPNSVTSIGDSAFNSCSSLKSLTIPNGVISIDANAFENCSSLTSITIPNSVTSIENNAFKGCSSLTSITIPDSVTSIGNRVFQNCSNLKNIIVNNNKNYISVDGVLFNKIKTKIIKYPEGKENKSYIIPNSVKSIGENSFYKSNILTNITIPNSVTSIEEDAFYYCSNLISIVIPNSVTSIGQDAFYSCSSLTSLDIPNSVTSIGKNAFDWCRNLTNITISDSVTSIGEDAFGFSRNAIFYVKSEKRKQLLINSGVDESKIILNGQLLTGVKLNTSKLNWTVGKTGSFIATVSPSSATNRSVTWKSSNTKVATVSATGKLTAVGVGTATITCTASDGSGKYATCAVTVTKPSTVNVTSVKLNTNKLNWTVGKTGNFIATVSPSNATNRAMIWKSSNTKVATVSSTGKLTAVGVGIATITCTASDGSGKSATCAVTVIRPSTINVTSIKLDKTSLNVGKGKTTQLKATLAPTNATNKSLVWRTGDEKIATVDTTGKIKGIGIGTTNIYCMTKDGDFKIATCKLTVTK